MTSQHDVEAVEDSSKFEREVCKIMVGVQVEMDDCDSR